MLVILYGDDVVDGGRMNEALLDSHSYYIPLPAKCGEDSIGFYDRRGDYFRQGVDPRNHVGRFVVPRQRQDRF